MSSLPPARLLFVVGLTGVGKSTLLRSLPSWQGGLQLLPNRRELTDAIIIPEIQRLEGSPLQPVPDRLERFRITAAYRELHPGGMVHALERWLAARTAETTDGDVAVPARRASLGTAELVFDNLRGLEEVEAARLRFPGGRFLLLDAPPLTRLLRLLGRGDAFDRTAGPPPTLPAAETNEAGEPGPADEAQGAADRAALVTQLRAIPGLSEALDPRQLAAVAQSGAPADDLLRAARIIATEQRHYDGAAARRYLEGLPPRQRLLLDTALLTEAEVARRAREWLEG